MSLGELIDKAVEEQDAGLAFHISRDYRHRHGVGWVSALNRIVRKQGHDLESWLHLVAAGADAANARRTGIN